MSVYNSNTDISSNRQVADTHGFKDPWLSTFKDRLSSFGHFSERHQKQFLWLGKKLECKLELNWSRLCTTVRNSKTSQELRMLSSVTLNSKITMIVTNSGSQLSEMTAISHFNFICICSCVLWISLSLMAMSCLLITLIKCLKGHKSQGAAFERCLVFVLKSQKIPFPGSFVWR